MNWVIRVSCQDREFSSHPTEEVIVALPIRAADLQNVRPRGVAVKPTI